MKTALRDMGQESEGARCAARSVIGAVSHTPAHGGNAGVETLAEPRVH